MDGAAVSLQTMDPAGNGMDLRDVRHAADIPVFPESHDRVGLSKLGTILEQAGFGFLHRTIEGTILAANPRFCEIVGREPHDLLDLRMQDYTHPADWQASETMFAIHSGTGTPFQIDKRYLRPDNTVVWCRVNVSFLRDRLQGVASAVVVTEDISELKRGEERLREMEGDYRHTIDACPHATWIADPSGTILDMSHRWTQFTGLPSGRGIHVEWDAIVHPDDADRVTGRGSTWLSGTDPLDYRVRLRVVSGEYRWFRVRAYPRLEDGKATKWYGTTEDIHEQILAEEAVARSEELYRLAFKATTDLIWDQDVATTRLVWTPTDDSHFGYRFEDLGDMEQWWFDRVHPDDVERMSSTYTRFLAGTEDRLETEYRFRRKDGTYGHAFGRTLAVRDANGVAYRVVGSVQDVTARKEAEEALRDSKDHYRHTIDLSPQIPWTAGPDGKLEEVGPGWTALTGVQRGAALGNGWMRSLHPRDRKKVSDAWIHASETGQRLDIEHRVLLKDGVGYAWLRTRGAARRDEAGRVIRWYGTAEDISDRKKAQEAVSHAASHDALTGLPNRSLFEDRLWSAFNAGPEGPALMLLDIDRFKHINDTYGHDAGDKVLREFADRLRSVVRHTDFVARLSGDEFAVIMARGSGTAEMEAFARALATRMEQPLRHGDRVISCRASIGGAVAPLHGQNADELFKAADMALYSVKVEGRNGYRTFSADLRVRAQATASAISQAREIVSQGTLEPHYQPKVDLRDGSLTGFEALMRWRHPRTGLQLPGLIAPAFDDPETGTALGDAMRERVFADLRGWIEAGVAPGPVAINASSAEFSRNDYAGRVLAQMDKWGIPPSMVEIEVTETVFVGQGAEYVEDAIRVLASRGVGIALDDFGTGFASLTHLKQLPATVIKIDRSFVSNIEEDKANAVIVRAILSLSADLGLSTVGEGIETVSQARTLWQRGCVTGQGYLFGHAGPATALPALVRDWHRNPEWTVD